MLRRLLLSLAALASLLAANPAQQTIVRTPVAGVIAPPQQDQHEPQDKDGGEPVEMFESPNLDRFLRRARDFLQQEKYQEAIQVMQSVIEGRTLEAEEPAAAPTEGDRPPEAAHGKEPAAGPPDEPGKPGKPGRTGKTGTPAGKPGPREDASRVADPAQTVFSQDGRIYRPARRLCHEYLAGMPAIGLELYRSLYESPAADLLAQALRSGSASDLELVSNRYFVTEAAGKAMRTLSERYMHEGRYRAAVQVLRDLCDLYPAPTLRALGISPLWCRFKIALCLRLAGEADAARAAARQLAADFPDESLRIMGELQPLSGLPDSPLFAAGDDSLVADVHTKVDRSLCWLAPTTTSLLPLWQYRFRGEDPYKSVEQKGNNSGFVFVGEGVVANAAPPATKYGTGTQIAFFGGGFPPDAAVFLENYRLRVCDAFTGLLYREGDGADEPPRALENRPRARVPVYDFALQRPAEDGQRYFAVIGFSRTTQSIDALKDNEIVAYDKATGQRLWSTAGFSEGEEGFKDVTFLAAPTVFGERLLAPVLRRGAYALQCLERATGKPLWCTRIHAGGTPFYKAPGTPVVVVGNLAYVLTNAGALAAIDAFAGDLRWIRRHERSHPLRQRAMTRKNRRPQIGNGMQFVEQDLPGFLPSSLIAADGLIVVAPCDSDLLMAIDGSSGEPVWMIDGASRYAPYGRLEYVVGANGKHLFAASETDLVCIDLRTGVRLWNLPMPAGKAKLGRWRGRGCVIGDHVAMPGDREILVAADGETEWQRVALPAFGVGDEPLHGPNNLFSAGPWLAVCYARGIEVYSSSDALLALAKTADEPLQKSTYLAQAARTEDAIGVLADWLEGPAPSAAERERGGERIVALARSQALRVGKDGFAVLDRVRPFAVDRTVRELWHLARLDLCRQLQDLRAYEEEQQRLYRFMEGKEKE